MTQLKFADNNKTYYRLLIENLLRGFPYYASLLTLTGVPLLVVFDVKHFVVDECDVSDLQVYAVHISCVWWCLLSAFHTASKRVMSGFISLCVQVAVANRLM